jgi:hypothetical protein
MIRRIALALLLAGAAVPGLAQQQPTPPLARPGQVTCTEPRPQMCPAVYQPVCGTKRDGARQTYSNGCFACMDASVISHVPGPC